MNFIFSVPVFTFLIPDEHKGLVVPVEQYWIYSGVLLAFHVWRNQ